MTLHLPLVRHRAPGGTQSKPVPVSKLSGVQDLGDKAELSFSWVRAVSISRYLAPT